LDFGLKEPGGEKLLKINDLRTGTTNKHESTRIGYDVIFDAGWRVQCSRDKS
jgi:hypothetical protein